MTSGVILTSKGQCAVYEGMPSWAHETTDVIDRRGPSNEMRH